MHLLREIHQDDTATWVKIGTGLALMGLSVPGRWLARILGPVAFVAGLELVAWGLIASRLFPYVAVLIVILAVVVVRLEQRLDARAQAAVVLPDPDIHLSIEMTYDETVLICVGLWNPRQSHIERATLNFLVPDFVSELVPADQSSARLGKPSGVMTTAEVLTDDDGNDFGNGSKYWQSTEIDFPGRVSSVLYFRVTMDKLRPFPVKLVLVSPDLDQPIELREMIRPPAEPTDEYPEPFQLTVEAQELSENIALLHVGIGGSADRLMTQLPLPFTVGSCTCLSPLSAASGLTP